MVELSIIIPSYNRNHLLNECINSIIQCNLTNIEIIIVNDYKKGCVVLNNNASYIKTINNPKQGVASARNVGASNAKADKLLFVDDDMILNVDSIVKAIQFLNTQQNSTYNANWIYEEKLLRQISKTSFGRYLVAYGFTSLKGWNNRNIKWKENTLLKINGITSQFFAINKTDFDRVGGYNEQFPFAGFEDYDLKNKLSKNNIQNYIDTTTLIYHNEKDRVNPVDWLARKKRGAYTQKVAVNMGFTELKIEYGFFKIILLQLLSFTKPFLMFAVKIIPNAKLFDYIYGKFINVLIAVNMFQGYTLKNIK